MQHATQGRHTFMQISQQRLFDNMIRMLHYTLSVYLMPSLD